MVAAPTTLSPLDEALLTRLYQRATLHDLFTSLANDPIENAPPNTFESLFALTQWSCREDIKPWIDIHAAQQRESQQREMIALLKEIAKTSDNQVERRRAATTVLRSLGLGALRASGGLPLRGGRPSPSSPAGGGAAAQEGRGGVGSVSTASSDAPASDDFPSSSRGAATVTCPGREPWVTAADPQAPEGRHSDDGRTDDSPSSSTPSTQPSSLAIPQAFSHKPGDIESPPTPLPDPARSPQDLLDLALHAIQNPNHPDRNTGPFTLFNLQGLIQSRTPADFADFRGNYLKNVIGSSWEFLACSQRWLKLDPDQPRAFALIDLTLKDNSRRCLHITLRRETQGVLKDCWLLGHFVSCSTLIPNFFPKTLVIDSS